MLATCVLLLQAATSFAQNTYLGSSFTSIDGAPAREALWDLRQVGANSLAIDVPLWQATTDESAVQWPGAGSFATIRDDLQAMVDTYAHHGFDVFLRPRIEVLSGDSSRHIDPLDPDAWFSSYTAAVRAIAAFAETNQVAMLSVGDELNLLEDRSFEDSWRAVVSDVRNRYSGTVTYAASQEEDILVGGGYRQVRWWDALDVIGINAFAPLTIDFEATPSAIHDGWVGAQQQMATWHASQSHPRPIVFTDAGYRSANGAAARTGV